MRPEPRRWRTRFGRWVRREGPQRVATELSRVGQPVTHWAVYQWVSGRHRPRAEHAIAMVRVSGGKISMSDIYEHAAFTGVGPGRAG